MKELTSKNNIDNKLSVLLFRVKRFYELAKSEDIENAELYALKEVLKIYEVDK